MFLLKLRRNEQLGRYVPNNMHDLTDLIFAFPTERFDASISLVQFS